MDKDIVIDFNNVSKKFQKGQRLYLKQALLDFFKSSKEDNFWALRNVNFKIKKGEAVGIIGANGSGKSTLLKLIAGVMAPSSGNVFVKGKIGPLIELGAGFHPELSGRDNIFLNGTILGLPKKEIEQKFDSIVSFAGLEDFIDTPVKHYSSGMYMRLGFAIAISINPDILLIDEILAVGDIAFQKKCFEKLDEFHKNGVTIVVISHSLETIKNFCGRVILLSHGKVIEDGNQQRVIKKYKKLSTEGNA